MTHVITWAFFALLWVVWLLPVLGALALMWSSYRMKPRPPGTQRFLITLGAIVLAYVIPAVLYRQTDYDNVVLGVIAGAAFTMLVGVYLFVPPADPRRGLRFINTFLVAIGLGLAASAVALGAGAPTWSVLIAFPAAQLAIVFYHLALRPLLSQPEP